jgi:hypothetical protein
MGRTYYRALFDELLEADGELEDREPDDRGRNGSDERCMPSTG